MANLNENVFISYSFGVVLLVMGMLMYVFGAPRTTAGAWDWQLLSQENYILNGPGISMIAFCIAGIASFFIGHKFENKNIPA